MRRPANQTKTMPTAEPRPARPLLPAWLAASLLALATIALYWPALQHGFVNYDDDRYVTANAQVQNGLTLGNLKWAFLNPVADNWHPLTVLSNMLVCQFAGLKPWAHHLANVLLHAANAALVFVLLRRLTAAFWRSLAVAALFAVHPLRVESVAWVAERKDVLSGFFGLLALLCYARYAQAQPAKAKNSFLSSPAYWLAWLWFALGLMSKPMLVTWPFVLLLLDYWPLRRISNFKFEISNSERGGRPASLGQLLAEKVPFFILAAAASVITILVQQHGAAVETMQNLPFDARGGNALVACCRYLGKMFWPANLAVLYLHPGYWPVADVVWAGGFLLALSALLVVQWRRQPCLLMGWLWFLGTLMPVIGLVQVGMQSLADRYTYLPSLGVLVLVVWGACELTLCRQHRLVILATAGTVAVVLCMVVTRQQLNYWQDGETLFRHAIAVTEYNYIAHYNLGVALDQKGKTGEAILQYQEVLRLKPDYVRAFINLGIGLDKTGRTDQAIEQYQAALRLAPENVSARNNLGVALFKTGQTDAAIQQYQEVIRLAPDDASVRNNFGAALYSHGQPDEAVRQFQEAVRLDPNYAEARFNLARVLMKNGQMDAAIRQLQELLHQKPDYPEARERLHQALESQAKSF